MQGFNEVLSPLIISALRLIVFVLPVAFAFTLTAAPAVTLWWTFPIAEIITAIFSYFILNNTAKRKLAVISENL